MLTLDIADKSCGVAVKIPAFADTGLCKSEPVQVDKAWLESLMEMVRGTSWPSSTLPLQVAVYYVLKDEADIAVPKTVTINCGNDGEYLELRNNQDSWGTLLVETGGTATITAEETRMALRKERLKFVGQTICQNWKTGLTLDAVKFVFEESRQLQVRCSNFDTVIGSVPESVDLSLVDLREDVKARYDPAVANTYCSKLGAIKQEAIQYLTSLVSEAGRIHKH